MPSPKTSSQLRKDIDSGRTGDKVAFVDPAAAPLGTDAEAGGNAPAPEALDMEATAVAPPMSGRRRDQAGVLGFSLVAGAVWLVILSIVAMTA